MIRDLWAAILQSVRTPRRPLEYVAAILAYVPALTAMIVVAKYGMPYMAETLNSWLMAKILFGAFLVPTSVVLVGICNVLFFRVCDWIYGGRNYPYF